MNFERLKSTLKVIFALNNLLEDRLNLIGLKKYKKVYIILKTLDNNCIIDGYDNDKVLDGYTSIFKHTTKIIEDAAKSISERTNRICNVVYFLVIGFWLNVIQK